jgi:hypothetical protein
VVCMFIVCVSNRCRVGVKYFCSCPWLPRFDMGIFFLLYFWRWGGDKTCAHHIATMADGHGREQCICVAMVNGHGREQCIYAAITVDSYALT